jgi:hypothetical protein
MSRYISRSSVMELIAIAIFSGLFYELGKELLPPPKPDKSTEEKLGDAIAKYLKDGVKTRN